MATYGLILNFIGALLLVIGSSVQTGVITKIIDTIADNFGTWGMTKIPDNLIKSFRKQKNIAFGWNITGYIFFIGSFGLQLYGQTNTCP